MNDHTVKVIVVVAASDTEDKDGLSLMTYVAGVFFTVLTLIVVILVVLVCYYRQRMKAATGTNAI